MPPGPLSLRPTADLPDLSTILRALTVRADPPSSLVRTALDTADGRLAARRVSLAHLSVDDLGGGGTWTLDLPGGGPAGTWDGHVDHPPEEALALLRGTTVGRPLTVATRTVTTRRRTRVADDAGRALAEVVDDVIDEPVGRRRSIVVLETGDARTARRIDKALRRLGATRTLEAPPGPSSAHRGRGVGDHLATVVADGLGRLLAEDPRLRRDGGVESVHQARVATRRLRSDLKTLRVVADPGWAEQTRTGLRWLGECLGAVRDADVLGGRLDRHARAHPDLPGIAGLRAAVTEQRRTAVAELLVALDSPRYLELLQLLEQGTQAGRATGADPDADPGADTNGAPPTEDDGLREAVAQTVAGPWRRLSREVGRLADDPDDEALHEVRIRAKELRYAAEAATPVVERAAKVAEAAKALQTVLGDHHDAVVAEEWLRRQADATEDAEVAFAAGVLVGDERADQRALRTAWATDWRRLRTTPPPLAHPLTGSAFDR